MNPRDVWEQLRAGQSGERCLVDLGATSLSGPRLPVQRPDSLSDFVRLGLRRHAREVPLACGLLPPYLAERLPQTTQAADEHPLADASLRAVRALPVPPWEQEIEAPEAPACARHLLVVVDPPCPGLLGLCLMARGTWRFLEDLADQSPVVDALLDWALATLTAAYDRVLAGPWLPDLVAYGDDLGYRGRPFVSPLEFRHLLRPRMDVLFKRIRAAHGATPILFHTCGNVAALLPDAVGLGVEALSVEADVMGGPHALRKALPADLILHGVTPLAELGAAVRRRDREIVQRAVEQISAARPVIAAESVSRAPERRADVVLGAAYLRGLRWADQGGAAAAGPAAVSQGAL